MSTYKLILDSKMGKKKIPPSDERYLSSLLQLINWLFSYSSFFNMILNLISFAKTDYHFAAFIIKSISAFI